MKKKRLHEYAARNINPTAASNPQRDLPHSFFWISPRFGMFLPQKSDLHLRSWPLGSPGISVASRVLQGFAGDGQGITGIPRHRHAEVDILTLSEVATTHSKGLTRHHSRELPVTTRCKGAPA